MRRAYRFCLLFYPRGHRDQFAEEMLDVFDEASTERRDHGRSWYVRFAFTEFSGLIAGAAEAWLAPQATAEVRTPRSSFLPQELLDAQQRVDANIAAMVHAIANHQFERARVLSNQEREARENLRVLREKYGDEYGMSF
jgi:hypothetical protein